MRIFILLMVIMLVQPALANSLYGPVVRIADADTVTVLNGSTQVKIRLAGIDAPESNQAYGNKAKQALAGRIAGKTVQVNVTSKDRYGRSIGTIMLDGENINHWLVANGWAWHYLQYDKSPEIARLEKSARANKLGLWADDNPIAPWEFRQLKKKKTAANKTSQPAGPTSYWLNTSSGSRHNSSCKWYKKTKRGRACTASEGKACGICGG